MRLAGKTALVTGAARGIGGGGQAFAVAADIVDLQQIDSMFRAVRERVPCLDILVNNAGRGAGGMPTLEKSTLADFDQCFALNTRGTFFVTQQAARMMGEGGRIVNLSSTVTRSRMPGVSTYAGSKAAVDAFTRIWAAELAPRQRFRSAGSGNRKAFQDSTDRLRETINHEGTVDRRGR